MNLVAANEICNLWRRAMIVGACARSTTLSGSSILFVNPMAIKTVRAHDDYRLSG
jgi:hypothetical protein